MLHVLHYCSVQFDGKRVVSGAYDYLVRVWDPIEGNCLHVLQGHTNRVYSLQVSYCMYNNDVLWYFFTNCLGLILKGNDKAFVGRCIATRKKQITLNNVFY